jgi:hypothetical protein
MGTIRNKSNFIVKEEVSEMGNKKYVGTFHSIDTVLTKITELKAQGHDVRDMYVVTKADDNISMLRGQTDVELLGAADGNWLNRFKLFLSGEEPVLDAFSHMGFSKQQSRSYYNEVENGGVALFLEYGGGAINNQSAGQHSIEMDSSSERSLSGEPLDGQDENQQMVDNGGTVPRLNTRNL